MHSKASTVFPASWNILSSHQSIYGDSVQFRPCKSLVVDCRDIALGETVRKVLMCDAVCNPVCGAGQVRKKDEVDFKLEQEERDTLDFQSVSFVGVSILFDAPETSRTISSMHNLCLIPFSLTSILPFCAHRISSRME